MESIQTKILRGNIYLSRRSLNRKQDLSDAYRLLSEFWFSAHTNWQIPPAQKWMKYGIVSDNGSPLTRRLISD